jgi:hypothetical protein
MSLEIREQNRVPLKVIYRLFFIAAVTAGHLSHAILPGPAARLSCEDALALRNSGDDFLTQASKTLLNLHPSITEDIEFLLQKGSPRLFGFGNLWTLQVAFPIEVQSTKGEFVFDFGSAITTVSLEGRDQNSDAAIAQAILKTAAPSREKFSNITNMLELRFLPGGYQAHFRVDSELKVFISELKDLELRSK